MRFFEDFSIGTVDHKGGAYLVTEAEIIEMAERWDPQPFHTPDGPGPHEDLAV